MNRTRQRLERCVQECARRAWAVAFGLLRDRDEAFDAVQQAFVVAARKPECIPSDDPWPWFGVVVAHEARNMRRKKRPTTYGPLGGDAVEPADTQRPDPTAAYEQAEALQRLRSALDTLPDREREAIVLIHISGMTHAAAAEALGIPRQTLTTHAQAGRLRLARLMREDSAGMPQALALLPILAPPGGWSAATQTWTHTALGALVGTTAAATTAAGGLGLMTSKTILILSISAALGAGFFGARFVRPPDSQDLLERAPTQPSLLAADGHAPGGPRLAAGAGTSPDETDVSSLRRENRELRKRIAQLESDSASLLAGSGAGAATKTEAGPTFTFGKAGRLSAVKEADWSEIALAAQTVTAAILEMNKHKLAGTKVPREVLVRLQENAEKMRKYEYRALGKIPSSAKHNGEFTHPITLTNIVAALLRDAGEPLSEGQVSRIGQLGLTFEAAYAALADGYPEGTLRVQRMLEEYDLKGRFQRDMAAALTAAQRELVVNPLTAGIAGLDLYGPTLMILHTSPVLAGASAAEITQKLGALLAKKFSLQEEEAARLEGPLAGWTREIEPLLTPVPASRARQYTYEEGAAAGRATLALYQRLLEEIRLDEQGRKALLDDYAFYIPRLIRP